MLRQPARAGAADARITNIVWGGVRLSALLADCEPDPAARFVWSSGADNGVFSDAACEACVKDLPLDRIAADVLVAYEMNGAPLRPEHGFPARLVVPGYYGTNSVKWLTRLTLAEQRASGPFTTRWYNDLQRDASGRPTSATNPVWSIAPESVIVAPAPDQVVALGETVEVWGWSWADEGVTSVEISGDGGTSWTRASLEPRVERAWQRFAAPWRPRRRGRHELCARAHTADGCCQPATGARNALHRVAINVD
jgi:sulfane dehydrogenase subunit SoxC